MLPSLVPAWATLPMWPSGVLPGEQSHFSHLRPRMSAKHHCLTGVLAAGMFNGRGTGVRVLTLQAGLLVNAGAVVPSSSEVVTEVCASLTEHVGPALDLAAVERNHGRSIIKSAWLIWERTSLKVVSICSAILVHWSLDTEPSSNAGPDTSWPTLAVWGPASIQAELWLGWLLVIASGYDWNQALLQFACSHLYWNGRRWQGLTVAKGGQMILLFWALPQYLHEDWLNF